MGKFINNINEYLSQQKIKQTFICTKTGMNPNKLSRILKGDQDVGSADMEKIAAALGQKVEFFLNDDFQEMIEQNNRAVNLAFYAGTPGTEQQEFAMKLIDLIENADEVLSAKTRLYMAIRD